MIEYLNIIKTGDGEDNTLNFSKLQPQEEKLTFSYEG